MEEVQQFIYQENLVKSGRLGGRLVLNSLMREHSYELGDCLLAMLGELTGPYLGENYQSLTDYKIFAVRGKY